MSWVFGVVAFSLGLYLLWGLLAPRSQWRALGAWSVASPHANEPSGAAYGWRRLLSGLGIIGLVVVGVIASTPQLLAALPKEAPLVSPVQVMWGKPAPHLVDRSVYGSTTPPAGLVPVPVLGYQDLDELDELPQYLLDLKHFTLLGEETPPGIIGRAPAKGFSGVGPADLVVNVRGSVLCIPREAVVIETETSVQIAIYYGLPDVEPAEDAPEDAPLPPQPDHVAGCPLDDPVTGSVLIPITLSSELGDRTVETVGGEEIRKVEVVESP